MASQISKEEKLWQAATVGDMEVVKRLATDPAVNVNWVGPDRSDTAIHRSCRFGRLEIFKELLSNPRVDVLKENEFGGTPLTISAAMGHPEMVSILLADTRFDTEKTTLQGATPFFLACQEGHPEIVALLLADPRVDPNHCDHKKINPFFMACQEGHLEVIRLMLANPIIDIFRARITGDTPFFMACQQGHEKAVKMLLADSRIDPTLRDFDNKVPFTIACQEGRQKVVSLLLTDPRIDVNAVDRHNSTPLWYAAQNGHLGVVQLLLASDKDINTKTKSTWNSTVAAQYARWAATQPKWEGYTDDDPERRRRDCPIIAALIDEYEKAPKPVRDRLRQLPGVRGHFIGQAFALVVFYSDNFVRLRAGKHGDISRFLRLCKLLPMDLQMVLCNRLFGSGRNVVTSIDSEPGFRWLARPSIWSPS